MPSKRLREYIEGKCNISVLYLDVPEKISGAACHHERTDMTLINRQEVCYRLNFDLAHELFHVLTWDKLPPPIEDWEIERKKGEKLANNFASGLLMPTKTIMECWQQRDSDKPLKEWIIEQSRNFDVSAQAYYWRLVNMKLLKKDELECNELIRTDRDGEPLPPLFSECFVQHLHEVLKKGLVSARKASELTGLDLDEFEELFRAYNLQCPVAL